MNDILIYMERKIKMSSMLEYKGYHASIEYDADDNIFVGEVFGIVDSLNFHGTTVEELKQVFEQSVDNYLELCKKIGKNPDKEFRGSFNVRISPELHRKAALAAAKQKITLNQYVLKAIERSFEEANVNTKETVIYIPYSTRKVNWGLEAMDDFSLWNDGSSILTTKENVSYVGN